MQSNINQDFINQIRGVLQTARKQVVRQINQTMVYT